MGSFETNSEGLRSGDAIEIEGGYQYNALTRGHKIQQHWHALKTRQIERFCLPQRGNFVLDVGCGSGVVAEYLSRHAGHVIGIDANLRAIEFARTAFHRSNLDFRQALIEEVDFPDASIDRIYCLEVIEHIYFHQTQQLLQRAHRMLKPAGQIFLTTPNYRGLWPLVEFTMDTLRLVPRMDEDQHVTHYHKKSLHRLLASNGFKVITLRTFSTFAPFFAFSTTLANALEHFETRVNLPFGNILMAVAEKNTGDDSAK